ncbi:hypothetical protein PA598K_04189 [Paenibacillus sp. 598K]|nr:hypothetical protein PA598K_04189 [Paenibacillus sp. 598K]
MTASDKAKLDGIAAGANNYTHPSSHPASIITQDASNRFVTDAEKSAWNAKETPAGAQTKADATLAAHVAASNPHTQYARGTELAALQAEVNDLAAQQGEAAAIIRTLAQGVNVLDSDRATAMDAVIGGQTRYNLLGSDGGCESLTPFTVSNSSIVIDSKIKRSGNNSIKVPGVEGAARYFSKDYLQPLDPTKTYIVGGWVYVESFASGAIPRIVLCDVGTTTSRYSAQSSISTIGQWQFVYVKVPTANTLVGSGFRLFVGFGNSAVCTAYFDEIRVVELPEAEYAAIGSTITGEEVDALIPYIDGVQSVRGVYLNNPGRNLYPALPDTSIIGGGYGTYEVLTACSLKVTANASGNSFAYAYLPVIPNKQYTFVADIIGDSGRIGVYSHDGSSALRVYDKTPRTFNSGNNNYVRLYMRTEQSTTSEFVNPMLVLGDASALPTSFVTRDDQTHMADVTLRSLPSGLRDSYNSRTRQVWRVSGEVQLGDLGVPALVTTPTNVDFIRYLKPSNMYTAQLSATDALVEGFTHVPAGLSSDNASNIGKYSVTVITGGITFIVAKGTTVAQFEASVNKSAKIVYRLATPVTEEIASEGAIALHPGVNLVELRTGLISREKANPGIVSGQWRINDFNVPSSFLVNRTVQILAVYKGTAKDNDWLLQYVPATGNMRAMISESLYDQNANYYVTYLNLDRHAYTTAINEAEARYNPNMGGTVGDLLERMARETRRNDAQDRAIDYESSLGENTRRDLDELTKETKQITKTLSHGVNVIESNQTAPLSVIALGQTDYNIVIGGGCESLAGWNTTGLAPQVSSAQKRSGNNSIYIQPSTTQNSYIWRDIPFKLDVTKYYVAAMWIYAEALQSGGALELSLRDIGTFTTRYAAYALTGLTVGAWNLAILKIPTNNTLVGNGFRILAGRGGAGESSGYVDEIRLREVTPGLYNAIGTTITGEAVDTVIPYIDGIQSVRGPAITVKGRNLLPWMENDYNEGTGSTTYPNVWENSRLKVQDGSSNVHGRGVWVDVVPGRPYTVSFLMERELGQGGMAIGYNSRDSVLLSISGFSPGKRSYTFTPQQNRVHLRFFCTGTTADGAARPCYFSDLMLVIGEAPALPPLFVPREDQTHIADVTLRSLSSGIRDRYEASIGKVWRALQEVRLSDLVYHESITTGGNVDRIRYQRPPGCAQGAVFDVVMVEGMAVQSGTIDTLANIGRFSTTVSTAYIDFIVAKGTTRTTFEATTNMSAKIIYLLATPAWEDVAHSGALTVNPGHNVVEVRTGVVLREEVGTTESSGWRYINASVGGKLFQRADVILWVSGGDEPAWHMLQRGSVDASYGLGFARILPDLFDASKDKRYVTYLVLDRHAYTTAITEASITMAVNLGSTVGINTEDIARIKVHNDNQDFGIRELQLDAWALETMSANRNGYGVTTGTGTAYMVALTPLPVGISAGLRITLKLHATNGTDPTINVNGLGAKPIRKPNGTAPAAGLLKANSVYTLVYDGTMAFILQGEGGEYGDAAAGDVLAGKTIGTEDGLVTGILALTGDATAAQVLTGRTYYDTDAKARRTGSMPNRGAVTITPGTANQTIQNGYHSGSGVVQGSANLKAANIRSGTTIFGVTGTLIPARLEAAGGGTPQVFGEFTVTGLAFQPSIIIIYTQINFSGMGGNTQLLYTDPSGTANLYAAYPNGGTSMERTQYVSNRWTINSNGFVVRGVTEFVSWRALGPAQS